MNPEKSERKSRRSSILKPPKPRVPFQNVELAVSSAENSPTTTTTKVKRRVSFAEKKHVKEFCDSMEQGTVWDNTYEESELGNMRNNENSNPDENIISNECKLLPTEISKISVFAETSITLTKSITTENKKDSGPIESHINLGDSMGGLTHGKPLGILFPAKQSGSFHAHSASSTSDNAFRISPDKAKSFLLESVNSCPSEVSDNTSATKIIKSANVVALTVQNDDYNNISMDETLIENISLEPTIPAPIIQTKTPPIVRTSVNVMAGIDFLNTDSISGAIKSNDCQPIARKAHEGFVPYQDPPIEITPTAFSEHRPTASGDKEYNERSVIVTEQKTTFQMKTVDTVTKILDISKKDFKELNQNEVDLRPERMMIFHTESVQSRNVARNTSATNLVGELPVEKRKMSLSKPVETIVQNDQKPENLGNIEPEQTTVFHDKSLELTEAILNVPITNQLQKRSLPETTTFHDKSAELTGIVQNLPSIEEQQRISHEQTKLLGNKSVDFPEVVRNSDRCGNPQTSWKKSPKQITDLQEQLMDITGVRSSSSIEHPEKAAPEKTMIFQNQPIEMTEVVPHCPGSGKQTPEKTTIFYNQSVDMTEAVRSYQSYGKQSSENPTTLDDRLLDKSKVRNCQIDEKSSPEKTTIFHNQSVDMTEAVHSRQIHKNPSPEKTTIFHNQSVDMTEVVRGRKINEKPSAEKTTIFHNQSVDMTEAVHSRQIHKNPSPEKTTIFHNLSVDMTEVVHSRQINEKSSPEKTTIFHNQSVDMTGVVHSRQINEKSSPEKTTIFHNQSVDMTEVVHSRQINEKSSPEKTTIFHNQSVDMTEVVHSRQINEKSSPEKTTIFHNQSVDMTEVVHSRQIKEKPSAEKTTIFHNQSVDMTEAVHSRQINEKSSPEKTTIFHNQSVDMTEVVHSRQINEKRLSEKPWLLENQSVDITEGVESRPTDGKPPSDKTIIHDHSVKMTGPVQTSLICEKSNLAKTALLQNNSADMVGVGQSNPAADDSVNSHKTPKFPGKSLRITQMNNEQTIPSVCLEKPVRKAFDDEVSTLNPQGTSVLENISTVHDNNVQTENINERSENQNLELIEVISRVPSISELASRDSCTLVKERMTKHESRNSEEANELIACIDVHSSDREDRSPVPKRMKSLGSRQSLDLTAAVPFVMYRKLARHRPGDVKSITCNPPLAQVHCRTASTSEEIRNISMDEKREAAVSTNVDRVRTSSIKPAELFTQEARHGTTNLQNWSMEMTEAIPLKSASQVCTDSTKDADLEQQQHNFMCHDDSMEITRAIPGILKVNAATYNDNSMELTKPVSHHLATGNFAVLNRLHGSVINRRSDVLPASDSKTMVFQDDSMELTSGIHLSSQPIKKCTNVGGFFENPSSNIVTGAEITGKTMVYRDDSMELTKAVQFSLQAGTQEKENCPFATEYHQSQSSRMLENENSVGTSIHQRPKSIKSLPFELPQKNDANEAENAGLGVQISDTGYAEIGHVVAQENHENHGKRIESKKQRLHTESDDITGVVAFVEDFETKKRDGCTLKEVGSAIGYGVGEMDLTDKVQWSSNLNIEKPANVFDEVDSQSRLSSIDVFPQPEKIQQRHSQVVKELFQNPVSINRSKESRDIPTSNSATADLNAEIRKLTETLALSNSVDESGFDQATFLRQQARCMEDYEANSTASQEFHSGTMFTKPNMPIMEKRDSLDPQQCIIPTDTDLANARAMSPNSQIAHISVRNNDNSQSNGHLRINREDYDRSLEELRSRAYSVSKFQPEVTGFELTGAISLIEPGNLHKSIFDEEPPSYVFSDSVTTDPITNCSASVDVLSTESVPPTTCGGRIPDRMSLETSHVSLPDITKCLHDMCKDKSEMQIIRVAEETSKIEDDYSGNVSKNQNFEREERSQRSQTFVIKRPIIEPTIPIDSSTDTETKLQSERLSGLTTADAFSSETPDGPNKKIRRRESGTTIEERTLPIVEIADETEFIGISRSCKTNTFANSTVISDDYTRQFLPQEIEETSILMGRPSSHELLSEIGYSNQMTVNDESVADKTMEIEKNLEDHVLKSPYSLLKETIENLAKRPETIWKIKSLDEEIVAFTFFSGTLVVAIYLKDNAIWNSEDPIEVIGCLSQLKEDRSPPTTCLAHRMIMKKISSTSLTDSYKTYEDIPRMLEYVTSEVKLGMDFMLELDRLCDHMMIDIIGHSITFTVRTRDVNAGIILNITMEIKPFEEISSDDIKIAYLLGREKIRENDIKSLITNVKRDHRFLRFYINDVRSYIELISESGFSNKKKM